MAAVTPDAARSALNQQSGMPADGLQFLTFQLGDELYGLDILHVQEIKGYSAITKIPNAPAYVMGVLNLRGTIVPVLNLRTKLGLPTVECTVLTVIIVVVVKDKVVGLVVDSVSDVVTIDKKDIQPPPQLAGNVDVSCLSGISRFGDKLMGVLEIDRLLSEGEPSGKAPDLVA
jgi:purine-binding chemotaxis protein CheW